MNDIYHLQRFIYAQEPVYQTVLSELRSGKKLTHWIWFIFPQIDGLGFSPTSKFYAIKSIAEAREYLQHPFLRARLVECTRILLELENLTVQEIFDWPDDLKLKSCMTLFASLDNAPAEFCGVLEKYFRGERDANTLELMSR